MGTRSDFWKWKIDRKFSGKVKKGKNMDNRVKYIIMLIIGIVFLIVLISPLLSTEVVIGILFWFSPLALAGGIPTLLVLMMPDSDESINKRAVFIIIIVVIAGVYSLGVVKSQLQNDSYYLLIEEKEHQECAKYDYSDWDKIVCFSATSQGIDDVFHLPSRRINWSETPDENCEFIEGRYRSVVEHMPNYFPSDGFKSIQELKCLEWRDKSEEI